MYVIDYAKTEFATFDERPFCSVDSLALSFLAYFKIPETLEAAHSWEGMRIADLYRAEHFATYYGGLWAEKSGLELLVAMAASPRFRDIKLARFVEKIDTATEMQFSATTFLLPDGSTYVAFKGTDATFVGWKEDFNLSFQCPVPSQVEAVAYLAEALARHAGSTSVAKDGSATKPGPFRVGGHSKGGNLAVYAAAMCEESLQAHIERIYSHDGPGFLADFMQTPAYLRISERIEKTIPQSSIVGMLLEEGAYTVVQSGAHGFLQHDPSTWVIDDKKLELVKVDKLANEARYADSTIGEWVKTRTREEREMFVNALYAVLEESDAETLSEIREDWRNAIPAIARALYDMDADTRAFAGQTISDLVVIGAKNVPELLGVRDVPAVKSLLEVRDKIAAVTGNDADAGETPASGKQTPAPTR